MGLVFFLGQYLRKGPGILDKPDTVYAVENQPASITITLNHVQATVTWKRQDFITLSHYQIITHYNPLLHIITHDYPLQNC